MITEIQAEGKTVALLADNRDIGEGTHPITDSSWPLQLLMMKRGAGHVFPKHTHRSLQRTVQSLQEAIVVTRGTLLVTVCKRNGEDIGTYEVSLGQCLLLVDGGYKIEVKDDASFFEFKNGPHEDDKVPL